MRHRILPALLTVILAVPAAGAIVATVATVATPTSAGAVSASPAWSDQTTGWWDRSSSPTIADIDGDGTNDIVIGGQNAVVHVISGANGHDIAHWPQNAVVSGAATAIDSTPAVGDLFNNGKKEIVVGAGSTWQANHNGGVIVFNPDGSEHCVFHTLDNGNPWANNGIPSGFTQPVFSSPAIGDIDGDGFPDIVFGSFDGHIYGISRNCTKMLDENVEDSIWSSPALYDVDGDGRKEIFIGGDQASGGAIDWSGGEFRSVKWVPGAPGNAVELWKHQLDDTVWSSPAIGDIDGDGRVEVVVGDGFFYHRNDTNKVFAWHADDGSSLGGWPITTGGQTMSAPALGDLTGDGIPEVVVASGNGYVQAYRGSTALVWATELRFNGAPDGSPVASPIIADMNGDGHNDVGAGNDFGYFVMDGRNGGIMSQHNIWLSHESAGAVGNFGSAGWKLIVSGFQTPAPHENALEAFNMPAPGVTPPWPEFRHDAAHLAGPVGHNLLPPGYCRRPLNPTPNPNVGSSAGYWVASANGSVYALHGAPYKGNAAGRVHGSVVGIGATHSGSGYYLLDSAGVIYTFGDAVSHGSEAGKHLNAPIIALAPTPSGHGYWLLGRDGGVFTFGDARFFGSTGGERLNAPIISMAPTTDGKGYWLLGADGGVFTFGNARFRGSTGGMRLNAPVISMATAPSGAGYWLVAKDGGVFSFHVPFYGSLPGTGLCRAPQGVQIRPTLTGHGYFMLAANGTMWAFGDAQNGGSAPPLPLNNVATDLAIRP